MANYNTTQQAIEWLQCALNPIGALIDDALPGTMDMHGLPALSRWSCTIASEPGFPFCIHSVDMHTASERLTLMLPVFDNEGTTVRMQISADLHPFYSGGCGLDEQLMMLGPRAAGELAKSALEKFAHRRDHLHFAKLVSLVSHDARMCLAECWSRVNVKHGGCWSKEELAWQMRAVGHMDFECIADGLVSLDETWATVVRDCFSEQTKFGDVLEFYHECQTGDFRNPFQSGRYM